jgi:hypothetical protein
MDEQNPEQPTATPPETTEEVSKLFTQADLDYKITERLKRERETIRKELTQQLADDARKQELSQTTEAEKLQAEIARLNSELEATKGFRSAFEDSLQARIEAIPAEQRNRIPEFDDPRKTMQWLDKNADLFAPPQPQKRPAQSIDGGAGTVDERNRPALSEAGRATLETARQYGYDVDEKSLAKRALEIEEKRQAQLRRRMISGSDNDKKE